MAKTQSNSASNIAEANLICNDRKTMDSFYKTQMCKIIAMANRYKNLGVEPQDIFQEGFSEVREIVNAGKFSGQGSFAAYFYITCRNLCNKKHGERKEILSPRIPNENVIEDVIPEDQTELIQIMNKLKDTIKPMCKEIIYLYYGIGGDSTSTYPPRVNYKKIAEKLNIKPDNARKRFSLCIKGFRKLAMDNPHFQLLQLDVDKTYEKRSKERINSYTRWRIMNSIIAKLWIDSADQN